MERKSIEEYLEKDILNSDTLIKWPKEIRSQFEASKNGILLLCQYLDRVHWVKNNRLTYKAGRWEKSSLKEAVTFAIFSNAMGCHMSALHIAWNGHTAAATMSVRRIYELLVDLSFMLQKYTQRRVKRFIAMDYVKRYVKLFYLYPDLTHRQIVKKFEQKMGNKFKELQKEYRRHKNKFLLRGRGSAIDRFSGDWAFGEIDKNHRTSIKKKAEEVGLGKLHYKLSYNILSSKSHPDPSDIASQASITDDFLHRVSYSILPKSEEHFGPVISCGAQYILVLFTILAKVFNFQATEKDNVISENIKRIKHNEDFQEFFKKVKIPSCSDF